MKGQGNTIDLQRFIDAQEGIYETALAELKAGKKRSHWMWFIFPQVAGLGTSSMAVRYAITSKDEAKAYLAHPILGPRLLACANALLAVQNKTALQIMGHPDDLKLKSSMTLFASVVEPGSPFQAVLNRYYSGETDPRTLEYRPTPARHSEFSLVAQCATGPRLDVTQRTIRHTFRI